MSDPTEQELATWSALTRSYERGRRHLDAMLKTAGLPTLDIFEALGVLDGDAIGGGLTAKALEERLTMPQYAVSRMLNRMERQDLIERMPNPGDKRSKLIRITGAGRQTRRQMERAHGDAISGFLRPRAKPGQLERMADLLNLLDQAQPDRQSG
jgi:DNA-binding MarR family transcriptional regulator